LLQKIKLTQQPNYLNKRTYKKNIEFDFNCPYNTSFYCITNTAFQVIEYESIQYQYSPIPSNTKVQALSKNILFFESKFSNSTFSAPGLNITLFGFKAII